MAQAEWGGYLNYKAKHKDIDSVLKGNFVQVNYFSVKGGAKRIIDRTATDDISLVSEFEQARSFKNIFFIYRPAATSNGSILRKLRFTGCRFQSPFLSAGISGRPSRTSLL